MATSSTSSVEGLRLRQVKPKHSVDSKDALLSSEDIVVEPVSPVGRMFQDNILHCNIICVIGFKVELDVEVLRSVLRDSLMRHKRFFSKVDTSRSSSHKWTPVDVKIENHVHFVDSKVGGSFHDFISNVASKPPFDHSAPLWEAFVLNFDLLDSKGQCVFRIHHSLGDGTSLMSLLLACTRQVADPELLPSIPGQTRTLPNPDSSSTLEAVKRSPKQPTSLVDIITQGLLSLFYTNLFVLDFLAATLGVKDSRTPIKAEKSAASSVQRLIFTDPLPMDGVTAVRRAVGGSTINDVVMAVICGGLHLYLKSKDDTLDWGKLRVRGLGLVNLRSAPGLQELDLMLKRRSNAPWGNLMGYMMLPMHVGPSKDPLDRVRKLKAVLDRKKLSYEALISYINGRILSATAGTKAIGHLTHRVMSNTTLAISNMIGPAEEVSLGGYPISFIAPTVTGTPQSLTVHAQSYNGTLRIIALAAVDCVPDPEVLRGFFMEAYHELVDAAAASTR